MPITVGEIVEGKVTGITKFGAFISLPEGQNGLIHISEISESAEAFGNPGTQRIESIRRIG